MKNKYGWTAYVLGAIAVAVVVGLSSRIQGLNKQIQDLKTEKQALESKVDALASLLVPAEGSVEQLEVELEGAQARIEDLESQVAKATAASMAQAEAEASEAEAPPEEEGPQPEKPSLDALRERLSGNPQVSAQIRALMEMAYADLFAGLDLDPDTKAALRDLLLASQLEQVALANYAMELGDVGYGEQNEWIEDERAMLAAQLKELLSPEDYAAWEEYEGSIEERQLEATFRAQLNAFSSGLTPENHELVLQIALEEFMAEMAALRDSDTLYTAAQSMLYQIRAMAAMRERLLLLLSEDQYAELDNWLTMGENLMHDSLPDDAR